MKGGPNTLKGFIAMAKVIVDTELSRAKADLARAPFTVQDNPWAKYNGPGSDAPAPGVPQGGVSWPEGSAVQQARAQNAQRVQATRARILRDNMPN